LVRDNIKKIEVEYNVKISPQDIYNARQKLVTKFEESVRGQTSYEAWAFSPYFIFFDMTINRFVARLPDGSEIEDMMFDRFKVSLSTQNVIILHLIELEAKDKDLDNYIGQLLGEMGKTSEGEVVDIKKLEEDWLINLEGETKKEEKKPIPVLNFFKQVGDSINKFLEFFGIKLSFFRALGPYEFSLNERVSKYYIKEAGITFLSVVNYIKSSFGVP